MMEDLLGKVIYVFETNLEGKPLSEQAKRAIRFYKAKPGVSNGRTGDAYAISTKDYYLESLPISQLSVYVNEFIRYARDNKDLTFEINMFENYRNDVFKQLFIDAPSNCMIPTGW